MERVCGLLFVVIQHQARGEPTIALCTTFQKTHVVSSVLLEPSFQTPAPVLNPSCNLNLCPSTESCCKQTHSLSLHHECLPTPQLPVIGSAQKPFHTPAPLAQDQCLQLPPQTQLSVPNLIHLNEDGGGREDEVSRSVASYYWQEGCWAKVYGF